jgi:hypothetical protein
MYFKTYISCSIVDHLSGESSLLEDSAQEKSSGGGGSTARTAQCSPTVALSVNQRSLTFCSGPRKLAAAHFCLLDRLREEEEEETEEGISQEEIQLFHSRLPYVNSEREKLR